VSGRIGQVVFAAAFVASLVFYALMAPGSLPWNESTHLAVAYLGEVARLPTMPHPVWGCYVQVFGGPVALSVFLAALAAGLLAVVVNRYLGWRFASAAAVVWTFLPWVWNRAVTGQRVLCFAVLAVAAVWLLNAVGLLVARRLRKSPVPRANRIAENLFAGRVAVGVAAVFAVVSMALHDYRFGRAAGAFAREVVRQADGRIIVMNGFCDDQVVRELDGDDEGPALRWVSLRFDDANRTNLASLVRAAFPADTNLWAAARIAPSVFAEVALKAHPKRFHAMDGRTTTPEAWEARWKAFGPYLGSGDPFVPVARRSFGYEGNVLANRLAASDPRTAWRIHKRVYEEIDPGNISALANMDEMIRAGYAANEGERKKVKRKLEVFFRKDGNRRRFRELAQLAGPVRGVPEQAATQSIEAKRRLVEKVAQGGDVPLDIRDIALDEWDDELSRRTNQGETNAAVRIARVILTNPQWRDFAPANAAVGMAALREGDDVSAERFLNVATTGRKKVPADVLNAYAGVLLQHGNLDLAEVMARRAVDAAEATFWAPRLTLAEVLVGKSKVEKPKARTEEDAWGESLNTKDVRGEIVALFRIVLAHAPPRVRADIHRRYGEFVR